jgi:hypothetical protein
MRFVIECLELNMFHNPSPMIKCDPTCLKVVFKLHLVYQIKSIRIYVRGHLEKEHFFTILLTWKIAFQDVVITTFIFENQSVG